MIHWCCYCQTLMDEVEPLTTFELSHGMCHACYARMRAREPVLLEYAHKVQFYRQLFRAADRRDGAQCEALVQHAYAAGFRTSDIMVGLIQPALHEIGERWERGEVTLHDEHRFSAWCARVLALLERAGATKEPLDLLIFQAPGNQHDLGPRIAEQVLLERGVRVRACSSELPFELAARLCVEQKPRFIGFSCALPSMVQGALHMASELRSRGFGGGVILSGQALRRHPETFRDSGATVCTTLEQAQALVGQGSA